MRVAPDFINGNSTMYYEKRQIVSTAPVPGLKLSISSTGHLLESKHYTKLSYNCYTNSIYRQQKKCGCVETVKQRPMVG